ncbi:MAG: hypothetical protein DVB23_000955 [Verrucomicrobia bacterium]|jgi:hypothetical protein|nr:MAG: hypothetical protein DVB23_000955 [Verrucomicrobiota bacterium]
MTGIEDGGRNADEVSVCEKSGAWVGPRSAEFSLKL